MLERSGQPFPHSAGCVGAERYGGSLESGLVVSLEEARHQVGGRMIVKVGREVREAYPVMDILLAPVQGLGTREIAPHIDLGASPLLRWAGRNRQEQKRIGHPCPCIDLVTDCVETILDAVPI